jgi:hypothetical protein
MSRARLLLLTIAAAAGTAHAQQATFWPVGLPLNATGSYVDRVSVDGSVAAGTLLGTGQVWAGFRWTAQETHTFEQRVAGLSNDGQVVLLYAGPRTYTWSPLSGLEDLGFPNGVSGVAIAGDGNSVWATNGVGVPYLWRRASGPQPVTATIEGRPIGLSSVTDNGEFFVGPFDNRTPYAIARLTSASTVEVLPDLAPAGLGSAGFATPTGVVVGRSWSQDYHFTTCRWTASGPVPLVTTGFQLPAGATSLDAQVVFSGTWRVAGGQAAQLPPPAGATVWSIVGCSGDGRLAVGNANRAGFSQDGVLWTEATGAVWLRETLIAGGVNLDGWGALTIARVSRDGSTVVGSGTNPAGAREGFVARLP